MNDLRSMTQEELTELLVDGGFQKYRGSQVYSWLVKGVYSFDEMNNIPKNVKDFLASSSYISNAEIVRKQVSEIDATVKYLFRFNDGECVESVVMSYNHGYTICISTQAGCKMGCTFCATGRSGFSRDLTAGEMLSQIISARNDLSIRISNVVLMGMGEPLDNFDNVMRFLSLVSSDNNLNIGMRHISLSTCGIVPGIIRLADMKLQITLSVSLHAPNDNIRRRTMPVARRYSIEELLDACRYYINRTNRRITFEYALIDDVNDSDECAEELSLRLKNMLCHVNLIPVNKVKGANYNKSKLQRQQIFKSILEKNHINVTIRRTLGADIDASCGQLKRKTEEEVK